MAGTDPMETSPAPAPGEADMQAGDQDARGSRRSRRNASPVEEADGAKRQRVVGPDPDEIMRRLDELTEEKAKLEREKERLERMVSELQGRDVGGSMSAGDLKRQERENDRTKFNKLQDESRKLNGKLAGQYARIADLETKERDLRTQIGLLNAENADLRTTVTDLNARITELNNTMDRRETAINEIKIMVVTMKTDHAGQITGLAAKIADQDTKIDGKDSTIAEMEGKIADLVTKTDALYDPIVARQAAVNLEYFARFEVTGDEEIANNTSVRLLDLFKKQKRKRKNWPKWPKWLTEEMIGFIERLRDSGNKVAHHAQVSKEQIEKALTHQPVALSGPFIRSLERYYKDAKLPFGSDGSSQFSTFE